MSYAMTHYGTCGYQNCSDRGVQFISRYQDQTDYCVNGTRVRVYDDGHRRHAKYDAELDLIYMHELGKYAEYAIWHAEQRVRFAGDFPELAPFNIERYRPEVSAHV